MTSKRSALKRSVIGLVLALGGAYVTQAAGCLAPFALETAATSADFCFIFDCQNGLFGGTLDPCNPDNPTFVDCPDQ